MNNASITLNGFVIIKKIQTIKLFTTLFRCIIEQLRFHYEKGKNIPGASTQPDPALSLLHQKIQMLNACIKQKIERGTS